MISLKKLPIIIPAAAGALYVLSTGMTAEEEVWTPESLYAPRLSDKTVRGSGGPARVEFKDFIDLKLVAAAPASDVDASRAATDLEAWSTQPATSPQGRPLPVAMHMLDDDPQYVAGLVKAGHHVMPMLDNPVFRVHHDTILTPKNAARLDELWEKDWKPRLEEARKLKLPIMFFGGNWAVDLVDYEARRIKFGKEEIPKEKRAAVSIVGDRIYNKIADPLGPTEAWKEYGRFWTGNVIMKRMQEVYPDPPLVLFGDNAETGELHDLNMFMKSERFQAKHGQGPHTPAFAAKILQDGYRERYTAMFAEVRNALVSPAWKKNIRFLAYNTFWEHSAIGSNGPRAGFDYDPQEGWRRWQSYEGSIPELYDNDWQPGKRDNVPFSMQVESGNYYAMQERVFDERPDFWWTSFVWDGAVVSEVFRGTRGTSKPFWYVSRGERWSFPRYEGWLQFSLWATRPRLSIEFRAKEPKDAIRKGIWQSLVTIVDRPWNHPVLGEFWRHGELVPNTAERPWFDELPDDVPDWMKKLNRWYILTTDANPARESWDQETTLNVFAQALVLGDAPNRRWLVNAHAPNGNVMNAGVSIPGYGNIRLPSVSLSGSFFEISESDRTVRPILDGGPHEIRVRVSDSPSPRLPKWIKPGDEIALDAAIHAPGQKFRRFHWNFGDGKTLESRQPGQVKHRFEKPGVYLVTATAEAQEGAPLVDQIAIYVGDSPPESVAYDLPLDDAIAWEGPWSGVGDEGQTLATYRHTANRSASVPAAVVTGGRFVDDSQRGRVFEIDEEHGGIWLMRGRPTVISAGKSIANRTISLWFNAEDVNKRQVLYASGLAEVGVNIYLDKGRLYAGSWATVDGIKGTQNPLRGYNWKGDWIDTPVEPGRWYQVAWVLKNGADKIEPERQHLYLDGKLVGKAPGAAIPAEYVPPRVGRTNLDGGDGQTSGATSSLTRFHDQDRIDAMKGQERVKANAIPTFRGRLDEFRYINAAEEGAQ